MRRNRTSIAMLLGLLAAWPASGVSATPAAAVGRMILIRSDLREESVEVVEMNDRELVVLDEQRGWQSLPLEQCLALIDTEPLAVDRRQGLIVLADGQRLPGQAISNPNSDGEMLAWNHPWLGRLDVPLGEVNIVHLRPGRPRLIADDTDLLLLSNGDRLEGLVLSFGDPLTLEFTDAGGVSTPLEIPLERVWAVAFVTPPAAAAGRRLWFHDGTVINAASLRPSQTRSM